MRTVAAIWSELKARDKDYERTLELLEELDLAWMAEAERLTQDARGPEVEFDSGLHCAHGVLSCEPCTDSWSVERRKLLAQATELRRAVEGLLRAGGEFMKAVRHHSGLAYSWGPWEYEAEKARNLVVDFKPERKGGAACALVEASKGPEWEAQQYNKDLAEPGRSFDLVAHLERQRAFSLATFGPGDARDRVKGLSDHITKELAELAAAPNDVEEWVDVAILALDGAWRSGATPQAIVACLAAKQVKNESRAWPDWRTATPGKAIEHIRSDPSKPAVGRRTAAMALVPARYDTDDAWEMVSMVDANVPGLSPGDLAARATAALDERKKGA